MDRRPALAGAFAAKAPAVSVLMAVRNGERFLDEAVASVLGQTLTDFELVIVDNGSRDRTCDQIAAWARRDSRVRPFRIDRPGLGRSLNHAAAQASADLLARLDADDVAEPNRLEVQLGRLSAEPSLGLIGSNALLIDAAGRPVGEVRRPFGCEAIRGYLAHGNPFIHSSVVMRRSAFERVGGYREGLSIAEDLDLWLRLADVTELDVAPELLVRYRMHGSSMMGRHAARSALAEFCIRASISARLAGGAEPFMAGCPRSREAIKLLHLDRAAFRHTVRARLLRERFERWYQLLPVSTRLKTLARTFLVGIGLKPVFRWSLELAARSRSRVSV